MHDMTHLMATPNFIENIPKYLLRSFRGTKHLHFQIIELFQLSLCIKWQMQNYNWIGNSKENISSHKLLWKVSSFHIKTFAQTSTARLSLLCSLINFLTAFFFNSTMKYYYFTLRQNQKLYDIHEQYLVLVWVNFMLAW